MPARGARFLGKRARPVNGRVWGKPCQALRAGAGNW